MWSTITRTKGVFCVESSGRESSYAELRNNIICGSHFLRRKVKNKKIVIWGNKNFENYSAVLSILFSGNTWVPLSEKNPEMRNLELIKDLKPNILITDLELSALSLKKLKSYKVEILKFSDLFNITGAKQPIGLNVRPTDISMIYFTSGSSGKPKGVRIKHESFVQNVNNIIAITKTEGRRFGDFHDLSFVISIPILFTCIMSQGNIFCANSDLDILLPSNAILKFDVDFLITVPSTLSRIVESVDFLNVCSRLKTVISCGEPLKFETLKSFLDNSNLSFYNFYGSTEVAPWIFFHRCDQKTLEFSKVHNFVPIGKLISGNEMALDDQGMLLIRGVQVTPGYEGEPSGSHLIQFEGQEWFPTNDVLEVYNGLFFCKGRIDGVIKIKGFRIHTSDIENEIKKIDSTQKCICLTDETTKGLKIIAFIEGKSDAISKRIQNGLKDRLPPYMVPHKFIMVDQFPINKNGKIDRSKLKGIKS